MKIIWTKLALSDLEAAYGYIFDDNPTAAESVIGKVEKILESLKLHPEMGRSGRMAGTRELMVPSSPFIIPYRIKGKEIQILAFMHSSRRWPEKFRFDV
jgi:toxin ParE1/3/4